METNPPTEVRGAARPPRLAVLLLLFVMPLTFATVGSVHGHGEGYVPDTHIVRNALGMAKERNPVPEVGRYSTYPNLLPYMLLPVYAGHFAVGMLSGEWEGSKEFGDHVLQEPGGVHWLARLVIALLSALAPWVVYRTALCAGLTRGALVSGWLVATCLLFAQFSTQERPWAPMTMFIALTAWGAVAYGKSGRRKHLVASGMAAGLAFATHQAGLGALGITGLAWLFGPRRWTGSDLIERLRSGVFAVAGFALLGYLIGHPYLLVHGRTATDAVVGGEQLVSDWSLSIGGMSIQFDIRPESAERLSGVLLGYDPMVLLLGLAGLALVLRNRALAPVTIWTVGWGLFFLTAPSDHVRYLLPVLVLLALPAGFLAERMLRAKGTRIALAFAMLLPLIQVARFAHLLSGQDTRADVEAALYELPLGSRVAVDRYGPTTDLSLDALTRLKEIRHLQGAGLYARERHRRNLLREGELGFDDEGFDLVPIEDLFSFDERKRTVAVRGGLEVNGSTPKEVFASLGVTHVLIVERRTQAAHLLGDLIEGREPVWSLDPGGDEPAPEAFLPLEMDFPLTAVWSVHRPGPRLRLFKL
ncbi:MAG: hypothetical protein ACI841_003882 [Planctomycetota bacterium]|jgi:hypothetical protein